MKNCKKKKFWKIGHFKQQQKLFKNLGDFCEPDSDANQ